MASREILMFCREVSYGVPDLTTGAPTAGAFGYIRLDQGNAFKVRAAPSKQSVMFGGGYRVPHLRVGVGATVGGTLRTLLYREQAALLMGWPITRIDSGRAAPWTTTDASNVMPVGDLASMSLYHGIYDNTGTLKRTAYRGCKVSQVRLSASEESPIVVAEFTIVGQKPDPDDKFGGSDATGPDAGEFPLPDDTDYPSNPFLFQHTTLKLGTTASLYGSWAIEIKNSLSPKKWEGKFLQTCRWYGRDVTLNAGLYYKSSPDYWGDFDSQAAKDIELTLADGTGTAKWDLQTKNYGTDLPFDTPIDGDFTVNAAFQSHYDNAANTDLAFSYT